MKKIRIFLAAAAACFLVMMPVSVRADEKDSEFRLEKDYASCTFTVTFENDGNYSGTITDEEGNEYQLISTDYCHLFCTAKNASAGIWKAHIENALGEVPSIKISVKASNAGASYDPNQTIRVGLDIADLKVYFEDRNVVCDWSSSENGDVVVTVTSLDTNVVLGRDTVRAGTHSYKCAVPEGTRTVMVSAVPSESAGIVGAERTFTLDVPDLPSAYVTFPEKSCTNREECTVKIVRGKEYGYEVSCEGNTVDASDIPEKGDREVTVPLTLEGTNSITVWITDQKGNRFSYSSDIIRDTQAPRLQFFTDYDGLTVSSGSIVIEGKVFEYDSLDVNGNAVSPATDGYFSYECVLHEGTSDIVVTADDSAGNSTVFQFRITYVVPSSSNPAKKVMAAIVMVVVLALGIYYFIPKRKKDGERAAEGTQEEGGQKNGTVGFLGRLKKDKKEEYRPIKEKKTLTPKDFENDFDDVPETEDEPAPAEPVAVHVDIDDTVPEHPVNEQKDITETADESGEETPLSGTASEEEPLSEKVVAPVQQVCGPAEEDKPSNAKAEETGTKKGLSIFRKEKKTEEPEYEYVDKKVSVMGEVRIEDYDENFDLSAKKNPNRKAKVEKTILTKVEKEKKKAPETRKARYRTSAKNRTKTVIGYCLFIIIIWAVLTWVIQLGYVPTQSMSPYIKAGDCYVGFRRLIFSNMELKRGDVVAFRKDGEVLQKRIIGMPGDRISFTDGYVYINGEKLDESAYLDSSVHTSCIREYTVPEGSYFMLGDNRSDSYDSRYWKEPYVPYDDLQAVCKLIIPTNPLFGPKEE